MLPPRQPEQSKQVRCQAMILSRVLGSKSSGPACHKPPSSSMGEWRMRGGRAGDAAMDMSGLPG